MKNEPWVRFGIRMSPKISEKPAERRKRSPPSVTLLTASSSQRFIGAPPPRWPDLPPRSESALERRVVPRVHGLGQEPLLVVRPELAHVRVGLDRGVDELAVLLLALSDVEVADHVAEVVEAERPAWRVGEGEPAHRLDQGLAVVGLAAGLLEGGFGDHAVDVDAGGVDPGDVAVVLHHPVDEALVARGVEVARVAGA